MINPTVEAALDALILEGFDASVANNVITIRVDTFDYIVMFNFFQSPALPHMATIICQTEQRELVRVDGVDDLVANTCFIEYA